MWYKYIQPRGIVILVTIIMLKDGKKDGREGWPKPLLRIYDPCASSDEKIVIENVLNSTLKITSFLKDTRSSRLSILRLLQ